MVVRFSEDDKAAIWGMREAGVPVKRIAKHLGRQNSSLRRFIADAGGRRPSRRGRCEVRLCWEEREEVSRGFDRTPLIGPLDLSPVGWTRVVRLAARFCKERACHIRMRRSSGRMVVDQVRSGLKVAEVAASVDVAEATVYRWVRQDRIDRGELAGTSTVDNAELRAAKRRIAELESELALVKRASALFRRGAGGAPKSSVRHRGDLGS